MVILLSAFNGIEGMIAKLYTSFDAPITISHSSRKSFFLREIDTAALVKIQGVAALSKEIEELVVLRKNQRWINANMHAVDQVFLKNAHVSRHLINRVGVGATQQSGFAFLGADLFSKLNLGLGSEQNDIQVYAPKRNARMRLGKTPFHLQQVFIEGALNYNQELNGSVLLWDYNLAAELLNMPGSCSHLLVYVEKGTDLELVQQEIQKRLGADFSVQTIFEKNELIFKTSKSERLIVFVMLLFVFVLASFNLVASLTMLIHEKQQNILILKSMGLSKKQRFQVFFFEGLMLSFTGVVIGLFLGLIVCWTQQALGWLIVPGANVPFPIVFQPLDFINIILAASMLSFLFTFFPVRFLLFRNDTNRD
ncbi:MAG: ABC transporter permease [Flavobacteriales bacterium]